MHSKILRQRANAIGTSLVIFLATSQLLMLFVNFILSLVSKNASISNPVGISAWIIQLILVLISITSLVLPRLYLKFFCNLPAKEDCTTIRHTNKNTVLLYLGIFLLVVTVSSIFVNGIEWVLHTKIGLNNTSQLAIPTGFFAVTLAFVRACIIPAVFEELLFRDAIQGSLLPCGERFAVITTSLLFAGYHQNLGQFLGIFILSLCLGYIVIQTKNLGIAMILHFVNNTSTFIFAYATTHLDGMSALALVTIVFTLYICVAVFAIYQIKSQQIKFKPLSVIPILKTSKSRVETMLTAPMFASSVVVIFCFITTRLIRG